MPTSKAGINSQSGNRLDNMKRVTTSTALSTVYDNIVDGTALAVSAPSGTVDGQKLVFTWEFGSSFTLTGVFTTSLGDDTSIVVAAEDKSALVTMVWNATTSRWGL